MGELLKDPEALQRHIVHVLHEKGLEESFFPKGVSESGSTSAVLFLLGHHCPDNPVVPKPCVVLNKRSRAVKQAGDLCFPGGRLSPRLDPYLARVLTWPRLPLNRWPHWSTWRRQRPRQARRLSLLFATSLRESLEEMRLNPFGIRFLGPLPSTSLVMFRRIIYPTVGWIRHQRRFFPNWEVEKIVHIPLEDLLNPAHYACCRMTFHTRSGAPAAGPRTYPCFVREDGNEQDLLWGATYRIVMVFLEQVFGFKPPDMDSMPIINKSLDEDYYNGT